MITRFILTLAIGFTFVSNCRAAEAEPTRTMRIILLRALTDSVFLFGSSIQAASPEQILKNLLNGYLPQVDESVSPWNDARFDQTACLMGTTPYFNSYDATHGTELWKNDSTASDTVLVKDIVTGARNSDPFNLTTVGGKILKDGEAAADFIIKGLNRKPLAPRKSISCDMIFRPRSKGNRQAVIHVFSSKTPDNPFDLTLSGSGVIAPKKRE